jgi:integrase
VPKLALNDLSLRSLKPPEAGTLDYWDTSFREGLFGCRVSQGGAKTFVLKLDNSRRKIGRYPTISLSQARTEAKRLLAERTLGRVRPQSVTFPEALALFLEDKGKARKPRTIADYTRLLGRLKFNCQLAEITPAEFDRKLRRFTAPAEQAHILVAAKIFFTWAMKRHYIERNPTFGLTAHSSQPRSRILSDDELKLIWKTLNKPDLTVPDRYRDIVKLLITSGQRRGEIAAIQPSWLKDELLTIPANVAKNGRQHSIPLSQTSLLLATSLATKNNSTKLLNGWSKPKKALDALSGVTNWTLHDLRRTFRSNMARLGVAPHIAERLVNHISAQTDMERVYDQYKYLPEMRLAMQTYEDWFSSLITT